MGLWGYSFIQSSGRRESVKFGAPNLNPVGIDRTTSVDQPLKSWPKSEQPLNISLMLILVRFGPRVKCSNRWLNTLQFRNILLMLITLEVLNCVNGWLNTLQFWNILFMLVTFEVSLNVIVLLNAIQFRNIAPMLITLEVSKFNGRLNVLHPLNIEFI